MTQGAGRQLIFRAGDQRLALGIDDVREVTRMPRVTRVPHAPAAMLGLANLRGTVIPVFSAGLLLDSGDSNPTRLVVIGYGDQAEWLGLAVDETGQATGAGQARPVRALDVARLAQRTMPAAAGQRAPATGLAPPRTSSAPPASTRLVAFAIGDQEFALPVDAVVGVAPVPCAIALMPDGDDVVIGSADVSGDVLPLLCLRALLALPVTATAQRRRVVVITIGADRVGLVVDAVHGIVTVADDLIDPLPRALQRGAAEARIQAICRLDDGQRLISVLAADRLLRDDVTATMLANAAPESQAMTADQTDTEQFLIFRIGADEFAISVAAVEEVAALPDRLTRLPGTPAFVRGVMNLRGTVVPVIDQGQRFGAQPANGARARVIVVRIGDLTAGFMVDAVAGVVRVDVQAVCPAPDLGNSETRIFERVVNLVDDQRIVLVISPRDLLDRAEQDLLLGLGKQATKGGP